MKKILSAAIIALFMSGCGAAVTNQPTPADTASLKALQMQEQSNAERIAKLEKELSDLKESMDRGQRITKQLGENYDAVLKMFNDYKDMISKMLKVMGQVPDKTDAKSK